MRRIVGTIVLAILIGGGCWFFGLDVLPSIVVVLVVAACGITVGVVVQPGGDRDWPAAPPVSNDGARREISELAWALRTRNGVVDNLVLERMRNIAVASLSRRHLDLDNPAHRARIERLIGAPFYSLLNSRQRRRVRLPGLLAALGRLEALEKTDPASRG